MVFSLEHADDILNRVFELLPPSHRTEAKRVQVSHVLDGMRALDYCLTVMNDMNQQTDEEIDDFEMMAKVCGMKYRQALNKGIFNQPVV